MQNFTHALDWAKGYKPLLTDINQWACANPNEAIKLQIDVLNAYKLNADKNLLHFFLWSLLISVCSWAVFLPAFTMGVMDGKLVYKFKYEQAYISKENQHRLGMVFALTGVLTTLAAAIAGFVVIL